tara:strand:- start:1482 stop:1970 length:489 start_codon:yes stop_codon:yes gene_type:complete
MTDKQRDTGRLITLIILIGILLIGVLSSCSNLLYQGNNVMVTHVLALTEMGDTVKIRIQDIQPQRIYNVVGYDFVRWQDNRFYVPGYDYQYDYRYYNNRWRYHGKANGTYGQITPYPNVNNNAPIIVGSPSGTQSYGGNTTGGAGAPVASNPVTSSGGKKFN